MSDAAIAHPWVAGGPGALLVVTLGATAAAAQAPGKETITFADYVLRHVPRRVPDRGLRVAVTTTVNGSHTLFTFPDRPVGPQALVSVHVDIVATAGDD